MPAAPFEIDLSMIDEILTKVDVCTLAVYKSDSC